MTAPSGPVGRRVVMFVRNEVTRDARVLREAEALSSASWTVTIVGLLPAKRDLPAVEDRSGVTILRIAGPTAWRSHWRTIRYYPWRAVGLVRVAIASALRSGPRGWPRAILLTLGALAWTPIVLARGLQYGVSRRRLPRPAETDDALDTWVRWRWSVVGWARAASAAAPAADVFHGHDLSGLPAAVAARDRRGGHLVYDSHEIFTQAAGMARRPAWLRALLARDERHWARQADFIVTVNDAIAAELASRLGRSVDVVVHNASPRPRPTEGGDGRTPAGSVPGGPVTARRRAPTTAGDERPAPEVDLLRTAAGIEQGTPIALYHGAFLAERGIEELALAILTPGLERLHAVFMGYGNAEPMLTALAAEPRFGGRLRIIPPVTPDEVGTWIRSADIGVMAIQPTTLNHRLSTPNKLFECLAAGVPVVVSNFPGMRAIVIDDPDGPLGEVCDPTDPRDVGAAIRRILEQGLAERADLRRRCARAAALRWNWETESARLVEAYATLVGRPSPR